MTKKFILLITTALCFSALPRSANSARDTDGDHLVPVDDYLGEKRGLRAAYRKLWQQKLLVTRGDIVTFVHLPGNVGEEAAVSIYRNPNKKNGKVGGYWLTVTQSSVWLWKCVPGAVEHPIDARTIRVRRCDVPLADSTARTIKDVWLKMLSQARADPPDNSIALDTSTEIFWATNANGVLLRAQTPNRKTQNTSALFYLANLLAGYCDTPPSQDKAYANEIEKTASALLKRVSSK